jgi:hypothetical protein
MEKVTQLGASQLAVLFQYYYIDTSRDEPKGRWEVAADPSSLNRNYRSIDFVDTMM